ncbi:MAG: rRNA pseudouridine synthase [Rhodospirillales bacterium]|nr:rRNA pseudouridine synthase [Rhodospirillales bacterium]
MQRSTASAPRSLACLDFWALSDEPQERGERIAKAIARSGLCSRREAEVLIRQGRVELDGETVEAPGTAVRSGQKVTVDGERLPAAEASRLFRFHKPNGVLTTARDPQGRKVLYDVLPEGLPRLMPVGRLDMTSEGLLLLTNDGELKRHLELPATGWLRRYRVRVFGKVDPRALKDLEKGIVIEGERFGSIRATLDRVQGGNAWLTVALRAGRNREVRRICQHLGLTVNRLIRISYGPFQLGALKSGAVGEVPQKVLREQVGQLNRQDGGKNAGRRR